MKQINSNALALICSLLFVCFPACSRAPTPGKNQLPTFAVRGVVHVDGKPVGPATLNLTTTEKKIPLIVGMVDTYGKFSLTTYQRDDGAPAGKFSATLVASLSNPSATISEVEPLTVEITKANYNLVLEFKGTGKQAVNPLMVPPNKIKKPGS